MWDYHSHLVCIQEEFNLNVYPIKGSNSTIFIFVCFPSVAQIIGTILLPEKNIFFLSSLDPILKGFCGTENQAGRHKSCLPFRMKKKYAVNN